MILSRFLFSISPSERGRSGSNWGELSPTSPSPPRDNFFLLLHACTLLEFMPDGELMRDRFVVITRRRWRRVERVGKTSGRGYPRGEGARGGGKERRGYGRKGWEGRESRGKREGDGREEREGRKGIGGKGGRAFRQRRRRRRKRAHYLL